MSSSTNFMSSSERPKTNKVEQTSDPKQPTGSIGDLVTNLEQMHEAGSNLKREEVIAKGRARDALIAQAREAREPLRKKYVEITQQEDFFHGGKWYHALTGDKEGHARWTDASRENTINAEEVYANMVQVEVDILGEQSGGSRPITKEGLEKQWARPENSAENMFNIDKTQIRNNGPVTGKIQGTEGVQSPRDLITRMAKYRDSMRAPEYRGREATPGELEITDNVYGFHRVAQGVGLAALETKGHDIATAAKALAFAEGIEEIPAPIKEQIEKAILGMSTEEQAQFVTAFKAEQGIKKG